MSPTSHVHHLDEARLAAISTGSDPEENEATHLLECARCRARIDVLLDADASTNETMSDVLGALRETDGFDEKAEARVLASLEKFASIERRKRLGVRAVALVAAVAIAAGISLILRPSGGASTATVDLEHATAYPVAGAHVVVMLPGQDERVSLDGTAEFSVRKLIEGHRFRVVMGDDEVEVRGTKFRLTGSVGGVTSLDVQEGLVEVRARCCGQASVAAGGHWTPASGVISSNTSGAPIAPASSAGNTAANPSSDPSTNASGDPSVNPSGNPSAAVADVDPAPSADSPMRAREWMTQGRQAFDDGKFGAASTLLDRALVADPGATWAKDARVLSGAARVLSAPLSSVASLGVGVGSFDVAARQAGRRGDAKRAALARLGAARRTPGEAGKKRWCQLVSESALDAAAKAEARSHCTP